MSEVQQAPKASHGIEETLQAIEALRQIGIATANVADDKKVTLADLQHLMELAKKMDVLVLGFQGIDKIDDEFKDLDQTEVLQLVSAMYTAIKSVGKAYKDKA